MEAPREASLAKKKEEEEEEGKEKSSKKLNKKLSHKQVPHHNDRPRCLCEMDNNIPRTSATLAGPTGGIFCCSISVQHRSSATISLQQCGCVAPKSLPERSFVT